jgi:valyl-tRNA synthetase
MQDLVDVEKERQRLARQAEKLEKEIEGLLKRLQAPNFRDKAPAAVVTETENTHAQKMEQLAAVKKCLIEL